MLNELRYNVSDFDRVDEEDGILVFKGNVYPIFTTDTSEENIQYVLHILRELCKVYDGLYEIFFEKDGTLKDYLKNKPINLLGIIEDNFENLPKLLYGRVTVHNDHYSLAFDYSMYDVANSQEFKQLMKSDIVDQFTYIILNDKPYTLEEIRNGEFENKKENNTNITPRLYHGTTTNYLYSILTKGLRQIEENSIFNVVNSGYVYLTSVYESAYAYANGCVSEKGGEECVIVVDTNKINKNNIVLDYDVANEYTTDIENSPYKGRIKPKNSYYKGNIASNAANSGTKYGKIGYKGIIMPNAILGAYLYENNKRVFYDKSQLLYMYRPLESKTNNRNMLKEYTSRYYEGQSNKYVRQGIIPYGEGGMCIGESEEQLNEVEASDISLKSFKIQDKLNPKFWINNKINSRVRLKLLDLADEFIESLAVDWVKPKDIVITGSIANYNWSKYSDVDVHILIDFKEVWKKTEFVQDYFDSKKALWAQEHEQLKIYGFPVEMYVEDTNGDNPSSGIYSLNKNKWIVEPNDFQDAQLNEPFIKDKAAKIMTEIDNIDDKIKKETDNHKLEVLSTKLKKLFDKLHKQRQESLDKNGEMGTYNIIWKVLRRSGHLDKIWEIINTVYNRVNSIK